MEDQQRSLRIPISSSSDFVEIFPDEIPSDVNSLLDVLRAEYAPLKIWRGAALEYYRQNQLENFNDVLNEIVSAMDPEIEEYYRDRGEFEEGIVEIFDALSASSLYQSYLLVDDTKSMAEATGKQQLEVLKEQIVTNVKKSETVNRHNEYNWLIRGFFELSYGDLEYADHYLRNVYDRMIKQATENRPFLYGSTVGLGAVAYARKKYSTALDYFVKAMQCNPIKCGNNVRVALATCCFKLEQYDRCRLAVDRVLSIDPCNVDALIILSLLQRIDSGKVEAKKRVEYHQVARDLCHLVTQLNPSSALGMNQMAYYKFDDWQMIDADALVTSVNVIEIVHADSNKDYSIVENLQYEDMFKFKRGLSVHIVSEVSTQMNTAGQKVTTLVVKPNSEVPTEWVGGKSVLTCIKSKSDLNDVCHIAATALRGSEINEIRSESYYILGRVYHLLSQYDNAMQFYSDALILMPEMSLAAFGIGQLYLAKEEFDLSYEKFQDVLKKYPDDKDTQAYLLFIQSYHRKETTASFEKLKEVASGFVFEADLWLSQGHAMHQKGPGEYAKSLRCYEMAHSVMQEQDLVPHNHVLLNMGVLYHAGGNLSKALHYTRLALQASDRPFRENEQGESVPVTANPIFLKAQNDVFFSWSEKGSLFDVVVLPPPTASSLPASLPANKGGVYSCLSLVKEEGTDTDTEKGLSAVSVGSYLLVDGVVLVVDHVDLVKQQLLCRGMIALHPHENDANANNKSLSFPVQKKLPRHNFNNDTIAHCFNLARIHEDLGQLQAATEIYEQLLRMHPSFLECYLRLSMIASDLGRKGDAVMWIERGIALDKDNADATVVFGDLCCQMEDWPQAKLKFEKICKERRHDARSYLSLGNLYFATISTKESNLKDSMKFYHGVLRDDPRNIYAANGLGMICAMEGKSDAARDVFSRVRDRHCEAWNSN
jgi:tetratricopeptide (TPR) repeat protein